MNRSDDRRDHRAPEKAPSSAPQKQPQQQRAGGDEQHGEGNYQATRDYDRGVKEHLRTHDVEREARDAAPRSPEEEREMQKAEDLGKEKAQGMRDSKDRMDRTDPDTGGGSR